MIPMKARGFNLEPHDFFARELNEIRFRSTEVVLKWNPIDFFARETNEI
jgi:hypothetical protein